MHRRLRIAFGGDSIRTAKTLAATNYKTIFRVDFKPTLRLNSGKIAEIALELKGYADWQTDGTTVVLQDFENRSTVSLSNSAIVYARDMMTEGRSGTDESRISAMINAVTPQADLMLLRVGFRSWFVHAAKMKFPNFLKLFYDRFFVQNKAIQQGICPTGR